MVLGCSRQEQNLNTGFRTELPGRYSGDNMQEKCQNDCAVKCTGLNMKYSESQASRSDIDPTPGNICVCFCK